MSVDSDIGQLAMLKSQVWSISLKEVRKAEFQASDSDLRILINPTVETFSIALAKTRKGDGSFHYVFLLTNTDN
jgi:hypothetical protein